MADHRTGTPGENGPPVPRDMPDQQTRAGEDPWDAAPAGERTETDVTGEDEDVPDTDEAGTGRQGAPQPGTVHPEHPVPDEPTG